MHKTIMTNGKNSCKVLIVHGWLHSAQRYFPLKTALEQQAAAEVTLYEFPGFGKTPARYKKQILGHYVKDMADYLRKNQFDFIIGHSMGAGIVLKAAAALNLNSCLILMNPAYGGIPRLRLAVLFVPGVYLALSLLRYPCRVKRFLIKLAALVTINKWKLIDELIVEDAQRADPFTAATLLFELAFDRKKIHSRNRPAGETVLFISEKDRVIPFKRMKWLQKDSNCRDVVIFKGIGHTIAVEGTERLVNEVVVRINGKMLQFSLRLNCIKLNQDNYADFLMNYPVRYPPK